VIADALDGAEKPLQTGGPIKGATAGGVHGVLGDLRNGAPNQSAVHEDAVRRIETWFHCGVAKKGRGTAAPCDVYRVGQAIAGGSWYLRVNAGTTGCWLHRVGC
jgi:hypothetical protein